MNKLFTSIFFYATIGLVCVFLYQCTSQQHTAGSAGEGDAPVQVLPPYEPTGNEPHVLIIDFENQSFFESERLGYAVSTMFGNSLINSRRFRLVDRQNLENIMNEYKLGMQGLTTHDISTIGQQLGVDYIISGAVTEFGIRRTGTSVGVAAVDADSGIGGGTRMQRGQGTARVVTDIRITKVSTGEIIYATSAVGEASSRNVVFGFEMLMDGYGAAGLEIGGGVQGFDQTLGGMASRDAAERVLHKLVLDDIF